MTDATRKALVTGAGSGLGRALVVQLRQQGWRVATIDVNPLDDDLGYLADVSDRGQVQSAVAAAAADLGGLDAVANCAGVFRNTLSPVHVLDPAVWQETLDVNLNGSFNVAQATLPHLVESSGVLVLVASTAGQHPQPGGAAYAASKAAVLALARSIALEYAPKGVRACSVSPGYMRTGMTEKVLGRDDIRAEIESRIPLGRTADPIEVAEVIAFMLGSGAGFLTGEDVTVDGGGSLMAYVGRSDVQGMWARHDRHTRS